MFARLVDDCGRKKKPKQINEENPRKMRDILYTSAHTHTHLYITKYYFLEISFEGT